MNETAPIVFERPVRIRFAHCDPAGVVFFPQYLTLTNGLVEDWFTDELGIDYAEMIGKRRIGLPIVKLDCDFSRPSRMGETLTFSLALAAVGRSSIRIVIAGHGGGEVRFRAMQVLVTMSIDTGKAIALPDDVRAALARIASISIPTVFEDSRP